jgi:hypothetical protein
MSKIETATVHGGQPHLFAIQKELVCKPLRLRDSHKAKVLRASVGADASTWRRTMEAHMSRGFRPNNPQWEEVSNAMMIPWFEVMARVVFETGCSFADVVNLTWADVDFETQKLRLGERGWCTVSCRLVVALDCFPRRLRVFCHVCAPEAMRTWLRICRNAGLLRGQRTKR